MQAYKLAFILFASVSMHVACNGSSMSGGGGKPIAQPTAKKGADAQGKNADDELGRPAPGPESSTKDDGDTFVPPADTSAGTGANGGASSPSEPPTNGSGSASNESSASGATMKPDEIVDGMEVFTDGKRCVERAKQLATKAGFQAEVTKTINLGFYKIPPARGLCDIHFMSDMSVEISDHEGRDSVLDRQIAMYCPCNYGWAKDDRDRGGEFDGDDFD